MTNELGTTLLDIENDIKIGEEFQFETYSEAYKFLMEYTYAGCEKGVILGIPSNRPHIVLAYQIGG